MSFWIVDRNRERLQLEDEMSQDLFLKCLRLIMVKGNSCLYLACEQTPSLIGRAEKVPIRSRSPLFCSKRLALTGSLFAG